MKTLLLALIATTTLLTACNNNVGGTPDQPEDTQTFTYPKDGYYISDNILKIKIESQSIKTLYWIYGNKAFAMHSNNKVNRCMWGDVQLLDGESTTIQATNCNVESGTISFNIKFGKYDSVGKYTFHYDNKMYPQ